MSHKQLLVRSAARERILGGALLLIGAILTDVPHPKATSERTAEFAEI